MPRYIKTINGNQYYYDQRSVYRPGRSPRSMMKYIGPVNPKRKKSVLGRVNDWAHAQFTPEPGEFEMALYARQEQAVQGALAMLSPILGPVIQTVAQGQTEVSTPANLPTGQEKAPDEGSLSAPQGDDVGGVHPPIREATEP